MKKIVFVLAITLTFITCKKEPTFVTFSGKITNKNGDKITIFNPDHKIKTFTVDENGVFSDTINNLKKGYYRFTDGTESSAIYLENGFDINLTLDTKEFDESINYTGNGSDVNNYLKTKSLIKDKNPLQKLFGLNEAAFLTKIDSIDKELKINLDKINNTDFIVFEKKNLSYEKADFLNMYEGFHKYVTKNKDFKVSDSFPEPLENISFDLDNDYKNFYSYKKIVDSHYFTKASKKAKKDSIPFQTTIINIVKNLKGEHIKNGLLKSLSYEISASNDKVETLYKNIMELSTDEKFKKTLTQKFEKIKKLVKGKLSPKFTNYDNFSGGTTSLKDLEGKFVYIDVWATWCGPCKIEIPHLKKVEEKYHGKNIHFVSISIDKKKDYEKWRAMVKNKELGGIQLFADNDWKSDFVTAYGIEGIPRFILIDPVGKIVTSDAPRPSSPKLIKLFTENGI